MTRWYDTDGGPTCGDCFHGCPRPPHWEACDRDGCRCPCRTGEGVDPERARELDDRPDETLRSVARDMQAERHGDVDGDRLRTLDELRAERYGWPTRGRGAA